MHSWGDESVDWDGINAAAEYIGLGLAKWGRVCVRDYKEKFGTVRVYLSFGWESLHSITHPRHVYSRYPKWAWNLCCSKPSRWVFQHLINPIVVHYHVWLYRRLYKKATQKWPHLIREIVYSADYPELLQELRAEAIRAFPPTPIHKSTAAMGHGQSTKKR